MPNLSLWKNDACHIQTKTEEDNEVHGFPGGVWPKVNEIARLEFELDYCDVAL